jgi:capsular exopolysaccharide synthesis family protein
MSLFRSSTATPPAAPAPAEASAGEAAGDETPEEAARINQLMSRVTIDPQVGTRLVTVTVVSTHPEFAAQAANVWVSEYIDQNLEKKTASLQSKKVQYQKAVEHTTADVAGLQKLFNEASRSTPAGGYIEPGVLASTVNQSKNEWVKAQDVTARAKGEVDRLASVNLKDLDAAMAAAKTVPGLSTDNLVVSYLIQIEDKNKEKRRMKAENGYADQHPKMLAIDSDIQSLQSQLRARLTSIVDTARLNYQVAQASEERFKAAFDAQDKAAAEQATQGISLSSLQSQIRAKQDLLDTMQKQADEAGVEASSTHNNAHQADMAQVPSGPFRPDPARNMLMALLVGFVLALGLAFGLDYLDDTVKTPEDITRKLHVPFLGLVPSVRGEKQPVLSGPVPHDFGESYRALRTSLVFTSGGESTRVITVTSAQPLEGKTTTACNLAMVLAFGGSRVLLMDADMRRPGVHKALKINNTVGLSHLLVGQARVREAIQRTSDPNFCVMTAGRTPPNPSELLSSERMRQLIVNLKQGPFDWVVIDTPPVLAVTDAVILTPLVDGVTFVVGAEMTRRRLAERAVHMIMASRPKVVGAVLIVAWTLFAFGAVYPWASRPAAAATLLLFLFSRPTLFRDSTWAVDGAIVALLAYGWLQCLPLPGALVNVLSPASAAFHQRLSLTPFDPAAWRAVSLAPSASIEAMINLSAAALFYWTIREANGHAGARIFTRSLALMGAVAVLLAILQPVLFPNGKVYGFWSPIYIEAHPVGPIISRNHFASWMLLAAPITIGYLLTHARTYWVGSTRVKASIRMLSDARALWIATCSVLMIIGVIFSQSRAGLIGLGATALAGIAGSRQHLGRRGRAGLLAASLIFGAIAWMVANPANGVLRKIQAGQGDDWGGRPAIWRATISMASQYPLLGVGLGAYEGAMPAYQKPPVVILFNHAHSQYLQWLSEGGAIGVLIGIALFVSGFRLFARRRGKDLGPLVHLREGALAGIVGLAVQSIWETPLVTPAILWLLAAAAALATERPPSRDASEGRS